MHDLSLLLQNGLVFGLVLSLVIGIGFSGLALVNPEIWLKDYPPDIQARFGPASQKAQRQRNFFGIPIFGLMLAILVAALIRLGIAKGAPLNFIEAFLTIFIVMMVFNLVDLLVLDWLLFIAIRPRLVILPGTEGSKGYKDYGFHLRAFFKGTIGSLLISAIAAGLVLLVQ